MELDLKKQAEYIPFALMNEFFDANKPGRITYQPGLQGFIQECQKEGINWLVMWILCVVLTDFFTSEECSKYKNFFCIYYGDKDISKSPKFALWADGVRAGIRRIKEAKVSKIEDLQNLYPWLPGLSQKISDSCKKLEEFLQGASKYEPSLPPPEPVKPPKEAEPVKKESVPEQKPVKSKWKIVLGSIASAIGAAMIIAQLFLPGYISSIIKAVVQFLHAIAD